MATQKDKGGGARKYGQNTRKCAAYRLRETQNRTAKTRRILKKLLAGIDQPGWKLRENRRSVYRF